SSAGQNGMDSSHGANARQDLRERHISNFGRRRSGRVAVRRDGRRARTARTAIRRQNCPHTSTHGTFMDQILVGKAVTTPDSGQVHLLAKYGNRHGLVAGATGTGKTVTLLTLAEGFSRIGVPVFMADVKGDVAGLAMPGEMN